MSYKPVWVNQALSGFGCICNKLNCVLRVKSRENLLMYSWAYGGLKPHEWRERKCTINKSSRKLHVSIRIENHSSSICSNLVFLLLELSKGSPRRPPKLLGTLSDTTEFLSPISKMYTFALFSIKLLCSFVTFFGSCPFSNCSNKYPEPENAQRETTSKNSTQIDAGNYKTIKPPSQS